MRISGGRGIDLVLDAVGKPTFEKGLKCLAPFGHLILFGRAGGLPDPLNVAKLMEKSLKVSGFVLPLIYSNREVMRRGLEHSFQLIREGKLTVPIGGSFPLARGGGGASLRTLAPIDRQGPVDSVRLHYADAIAIVIERNRPTVVNMRDSLICGVGIGVFTD